MEVPCLKLSFRALAVTWAALFCLSIPPPAAAQDAEEQGFPSTGPLSGYMDFHFNKADGEDGVLDFHRFVLLFNHSFSSRVRFVGELELEHALVEGLEEAGELELEQAYVDFLLSRALNVRAGMLLMPVGIINERHEPPVFNGVERPFVDTVIVPSTWFDVGAGVHGELGRGWRYRAYVVAPLNALEFTADEGIRGGRQKGAEANVRNVAYTARAEYRAVQSPHAWRERLDRRQQLRGAAARHVGDARRVRRRFRRERLELRWQFAQVHIADAERLNDSIGRTVGVLAEHCQNAAWFLR